MGRAPSAPFEPLHLMGESITLDTSGKVLVLPVEDPDTTLLGFNQKTLDPNRLTIAESPLGGYNGALDYAPGSLHVTSGDGVYLTDVAGNNLSKDLSAGKLQRLGYLTVDTAAHAITEEFIVKNTAESNNPTVIDNCSSTTGWVVTAGTGSLSVEDGMLKFAGLVAASPAYAHVYSPSVVWPSGVHFITLKIKSSLAGNIEVIIFDITGKAAVWSGDRLAVTANTLTTFVLPVKAPASLLGLNPNTIAAGFDPTQIRRVKVGIFDNALAGQNVSFWVNNITADVAKSAYIELQTPNNLADTSLVSQKWNGSAYETNRVLKLDLVASIVSADTTKMVFGDQTKFDDVYGTGLGRSNFPKGAAGQTVSGTLTGSQMTYSANKGTSKRVGFRVDLPPSDGGRTAFNTCRFKIITYYSTDSAGKRAATFEFDDSTNAVYGLQNQKYPWVALLNDTTQEIDFFLPTHRFKNLSFKRDESGNIYELTLYPGNGQIFHGRITYPDLTRDSDSSGIPDFLKSSIPGSITKFLQSYDFSTLLVTTSEGDFITTTEGETWEVN